MSIYTKTSSELLATPSDFAVNCCRLVQHVQGSCGVNPCFKLLASFCSRNFSAARSSPLALSALCYLF